MKKLGFRDLIILVNVILYLIFFGMFIIIFNQFYIKKSQEKVLNENLYFSNIVRDFIFEERDLLVQGAKVLVRDDLLFHAVVNDYYISLPDRRRKKLSVKTSKMNKFKFLRLVSYARTLLNGEFYTANKEIDLFDKNLNLLITSKGLKNEYDDPKKEKYLIDSIGKDRGGIGAALGVFSINQGKIFIKGIDGFNKDTYEGLAVITMEVDHDFIEKLKKKVNREIIVIKNDTILHSTLYENTENIKDINVNTFIKNIDNNSYREILFNNKRLGFHFIKILDYNSSNPIYFGVGYDIELSNEINKKSTEILLKIEIFISLILLMFLYFLISYLFKPFNIIFKGLNEIKEGKYKNRLNIKGVGELKILGENINSLADTIELREADLINFNKNLEKKVEDRTASITNLLNNVNQGFLAFNESLVIDNEYSAKCVKIFGGNIAGKNFGSLVYKNDAENYSLFNDIIVKVYTIKDIKIKKRLLKLLPNEFFIKQRIINAKYKFINVNEKNEIMVILTDITAKREMQSKMKEERNNVKMVVMVISDFTDFKEVFSSFKNFYKKKILEILKQDYKDALFEIYRLVHTFKGNFSQYYFKHTVEKLNELEDKLSGFIKKNIEFTNLGFKEYIHEIEFEKFVNEDMIIVKSILGEEFFTKEDTINVNKQSLIEIEEKMILFLSETENNVLLPEIRKLRFRDFKEMIGIYPGYIYNLAENCNKKIKKFEVIGDEIYIAPEIYNHFVKALVNIFKNMLDHGIETIEDRDLKGKDIEGKITCCIRLNEQKIIIEISDDGNGINFDVVKDKLIEKNLFSAEIVKKLNEEVLLESLFFDDFSTKEEVSELSGRGVGLSAVRHEIERLDGSIKIVTIKDKGTKFIIQLPYTDISKTIEIPTEKVFYTLLEKLKESIELETGFVVRSEEVIKYEDKELIDIFPISSVIDIRGSLEAQIFLSSQKEIAMKMLESFGLEDILEEEIPLYVGDVISELLNLAIGNVSQQLCNNEEIKSVKFNTPNIISSEELKIGFSNSTVWTAIMKTDEGDLMFNFVKKNWH